MSCMFESNFMKPCLDQTIDAYYIMTLRGGVRYNYNLFILVHELSIFGLSALHVSGHYYIYGGQKIHLRILTLSLILILN